MRKIGVHIVAFGMVCLLICACVDDAVDKPVSVQLANAPEDQRINILYKTLSGISRKHKIYEFFTDDADLFLFKDSRVIDLYRHPESHIKTTFALMAKSGVETSVKLIAVKVSQCLVLDKYLELLRVGLHDLEEGRLQPVVMEAVIAPGAEWGTVLYVNYEQPSVRVELEEVRTSKSSTERIKQLVDSVLSGRQAKYVKENAGPGHPMPIIGCDQN